MQQYSGPPWNSERTTELLRNDLGFGDIISGPNQSDPWMAYPIWSWQHERESQPARSVHIPDADWPFNGPTLHLHRNYGELSSSAYRACNDPKMASLRGTLCHCTNAPRLCLSPSVHTTDILTTGQSLIAVLEWLVKTMYILIDRSRV